MNSAEVKALVERDPEAGAAYIYGALKRGEVDATFDFDRADRRARRAEACERMGLAVLTGAGIAFCFIVYCMLRLARPFVRIACGLLIFLLSIGGAIAYFVHQATGVQALVIAGIVVACFAVRELYDLVVLWFGGRGHAVIT